MYTSLFRNTNLRRHPYSWMSFFSFFDIIKNCQQVYKRHSKRKEKEHGKR